MPATNPQVVGFLLPQFRCAHNTVLQRLEEIKCHSYLQVGQEGGAGELQASQLHLSPWEGDRAANPANYFQAHCSGFAWDGVHFLHSRPYGAMFGICDQNGVDDRPVLELLLNHICTASVKAFPVLSLPPQRVNFIC